MPSTIPSRALVAAVAMVILAVGLAPSPVHAGTTTAGFLDFNYVTTGIPGVLNPPCPDGTGSVDATVGSSNATVTAFDWSSYYQIANGSLFLMMLSLNTQLSGSSTASTVSFDLVLDIAVYGVDDVTCLDDGFPPCLGIVGMDLSGTRPTANTIDVSGSSSTSSSGLTESFFYTSGCGSAVRTVPDNEVADIWNLEAAVNP